MSWGLVKIGLAPRTPTPDPGLSSGDLVQLWGRWWRVESPRRTPALGVLANLIETGGRGRPRRLQGWLVSPGTPIRRRLPAPKRSVPSPSGEQMDLFG